jgi:hypothetical protein
MSSVAGIAAAAPRLALAAAGGSMSVAGALQALRLHTTRSVDIVDTTDHIQKNLDALIKLGASVHTLAASDGSTLTVNASQFKAGGTLLGKWAATSGNTVSLTGATAASAITIAANASLSWVRSIQVSDTSQNIQKNIDALEGLSGSDGPITSIIQTGTTAPITLTATQLANDGDALSKIRNGTYSLAITGASVSQTLSYSADSHIRAVSIRDSTSAVAGNLDQLQALGLKVKSITTTDTTALDVQASQVRTDALVLGKVVSSYHLHVLNAAASQLSGLARNTKVLTVGLVDTAANLAGNWKLLNKLEGSLDSVEVTDGNPVTISADQFATSATLLAKFDLAPTDYQLAITGVSAGAASELASQSTRIASIDIADTGANVGANLADLQGLLDAGTLHTITLARGSSQIALSGDDLASYGAVLGTIQGGSYALSVSGLSASAAQTLLGSNAHVASVSVTDSAADIGSQFGSLAAMGKRLSSINQTDGGSPIALTMGDYAHASPVLTKIQGGYALTVSGVSAAKVTTVAADSHVNSLSVTDTAAALGSHWSNLLNAQPVISAIGQSDDAPVSLGIAGYQSASSAGLLAKLGQGISLAVSGVSVAQAATVAADPLVGRLDVSDVSSNVAAHLGDLAALQSDGKLGSITQQGAPGPFRVTAGQLGGLTDTLALIKGGNYSLDVTQVAAADAQALASGNRHVSSLSVADSSSGIVDNLAGLGTLGARLVRIDQSDSGIALALTPALLSADAPILDKITGGYTADISGANASNAAAIATNPHVVSISLSDTGAQIAAHWDALSSIGGKLIGKAITQTDSSALALSADQVGSGGALLDQLSNPYQLDIRQASASQAAALAASDLAPSITGIRVTDTAAAVGAQFDALALNGKVSAIQITGDTPVVPLRLSAAQYSTDSAVLSIINGSHYPLAISQAAAADAAGIAANTDVQSLTVSDSSSAISAQLATLAGLSKLQRVSLTDAGATIALSQTALLASADLLDKIGSAYDLSVSAATMDYLDTVSATAHVVSIAIADTSANVAAGFDTLTSLGSTIGQITLSDPATPMALSEAQWQAGGTVLASIQGGYQLALGDVQAADAATAGADDAVQTIEVSDTADNLSCSWDSLVALHAASPTKLAAITVSDNNALVLSADQQSAGAGLLQALLPDASVQTA